MGLLGPKSGDMMAGCAQAIAECAAKGNAAARRHAVRGKESLTN
jgi:hypothetical protein